MLKADWPGLQNDSPPTPPHPQTNFFHELLSSRTVRNNESQRVWESLHCGRLGKISPQPGGALEEQFVMEMLTRQLLPDPFPHARDSAETGSRLCSREAATDSAQRSLILNYLLQEMFFFFFFFPQCAVAALTFEGKKKRKKKRSRTGDSTKATGDIVAFFSQISQWEPDSATSLGLHCNVSPEETFSLFLSSLFEGK